jgi:hypothetical protein
MPLRAGQGSGGGFALGGFGSPETSASAARWSGSKMLRPRLLAFRRRLATAIGHGCARDESPPMTPFGRVTEDLLWPRAELPGPCWLTSAASALPHRVPAPRAKA